MSWSMLWLLAEGGGHGHDHAGVLTPEQGLIFWSVLTFCVVMVTLKKLAWGPIMKGLEDREKKIRSALNAAEEAKKEAARIAAEQSAELESHRQEAEKILEEARADAKAIVDKAHKKATDEAEDVKTRTLKEIELAKAKAIDEIRQESVDLAMALAGRVLQAEVKAGQHKALVDEFITSWSKN